MHNFRVEDVNDNAPRFWRDQYESFLPENSNAFETPLVIQAEDRDENGQYVTFSENLVDDPRLSGTGNAMVRYRIVEGDTGGNFSIDSVTGEVGYIAKLVIGEYKDKYKDKDSVTGEVGYILKVEL